jgi:riboflavin synthase
MFTGIIEERGSIKSVRNIPGGKKITISASRILDDLQIEHSVAISGVCLTVVHLDKKSFTVEAVGETLEKTTFRNIQTGTFVNLERAIRLSDRLGGHLVQGHVNGIGKIHLIYQRGDNWYLEIKIPENLKKYVILEGSIAIDGVSLTVATIVEDRIGLSIIPYTYDTTIIKELKKGDQCNIETDIIGRYVENLLFHKDNEKSKDHINLNWLKNKGF